MLAFDSVVAFGDSNIDNGNAAAAAAALGITINPPPNYGGRSTNGPVVVEYVAQDLGVPLLDHAYAGATTGTGYADNILTCEGCIQKASSSAQPCLDAIHP